MNEHSQGAGPNTTSRLKSTLPIVEWLREYQNDWLRPDVIAGLTAAAMVIPKAMAYAVIAGPPVQVEFYTAFLPMIINAALGARRFRPTKKHARLPARSGMRWSNVP